MAKETTFDHPPRGHVAILGYENASDKFIVAALDADGRLEIVLPYEEALGAREYQYDGSTWRKSNLLWGYYDTVHGAVQNTNCGAGAVNLDSSQIPTGEVHVIHTAIWWWSGVTCTALYFKVGPAASPSNFDYKVTPTSGILQFTRDTIVLKAGDIVRLSAEGLTAGDDLYLQWHGYKMKADM